MDQKSRMFLFPFVHVTGCVFWNRIHPNPINYLSSQCRPFKITDRPTLTTVNIITDVAACSANRLFFPLNKSTISAFLILKKRFIVSQTVYLLGVASDITRAPHSVRCTSVLLAGEGLLKLSPQSSRICLRLYVTSLYDICNHCSSPASAAHLLRWMRRDLIQREIQP